MMPGGGLEFEFSHPWHQTNKIFVVYPVIILQLFFSPVYPS